MEIRLRQIKKGRPRKNKTYSDPKKIIPILIKSGFIETSNIAESSGLSKRTLRFPSTREKVLFKNGYIYLPDGHKQRNINCTELKSLITYCLISRTDRTALKLKGLPLTAISKIVADFKAEPEEFSSALFRRIVDVYENIKL